MFCNPSRFYPNPICKLSRRVPYLLVYIMEVCKKVSSETARFSIILFLSTTYLTDLEPGSLIEEASIRRSVVGLRTGHPMLACSNFESDVIRALQGRPWLHRFLETLDTMLEVIGADTSLRAGTMLAQHLCEQARAAAGASAEQQETDRRRVITRDASSELDRHANRIAQLPITDRPWRPVVVAVEE